MSPGPLTRAASTDKKVTDVSRLVAASAKVTLPVWFLRSGVNSVDTGAVTLRFGLLSVPRYRNSERFSESIDRAIDMRR